MESVVRTCDFCGCGLEVGVHGRGDIPFKLTLTIASPPAQVRLEGREHSVIDICLECIDKALAGLNCSMKRRELNGSQAIAPFIQRMVRHEILPFEPVDAERVVSEAEQQADAAQNAAQEEAEAMAARILALRERHAGHRASKRTPKVSEPESAPAELEPDAQIGPGTALPTNEEERAEGFGGEERANSFGAESE